MQKDEAMKSVFIGYDGKEYSITSISDIKAFIKIPFPPSFLKEQRELIGKLKHFLISIPFKGTKGCAHSLSMIILLAYLIIQLEILIQVLFVVDSRYPNEYLKTTIRAATIFTNKSSQRICYVPSNILSVFRLFSPFVSLQPPHNGSNTIILF